MLHTLILNVEQFVKQLSYAKYMVLVSSVKLARCLMGKLDAPDNFKTASYPTTIFSFFTIQVRHGVSPS